MNHCQRHPSSVPHFDRWRDGEHGASPFLRHGRHPSKVWEVQQDIETELILHHAMNPLLQLRHMGEVHAGTFPTFDVPLRPHILFATPARPCSRAVQAHTCGAVWH